jgi:TPR repeat protein
MRDLGIAFALLLGSTATSGSVDASELPALRQEAYELTGSQFGSFSAFENYQIRDNAIGFSMRDRDLFSNLTTLRDFAAQANNKGFDFSTSELCTVATASLVAMDMAPAMARLTFEIAEKGMLAMSTRPGAIRCMGDIMFRRRKFESSVHYLEKAEETTSVPLLLALARWYSGDRSAALTDMKRHYEAAAKAGRLAWQDDIWLAVMHQREGLPLPEASRARALKWKEGLWPGAIMGLHAGLLTPEEVLAAAQEQAPTARELALGEAWFHIGQHWLSAGNVVEARKAFRWLGPNAIRRTPEFVLAKAELDALDSLDRDVEAGLAAKARGDYKAALAAFLRAVERGNPEAFYRAGLAYLNAQGTERNYAEAMRLSLLGAAAGHFGAQNSVGSMYQDGRGVEGSMPTAVSWYTQAVQGMDSDALFNLAKCYEDGLGVEKDLKLAYHYYRLVAQLGDVEAMAKLGGYLFNGNGATQDDVQALFWNVMAADAGNADALVALAEHFRLGRGVKPDIKRALELNMSAAKKGNAMAQYNLGIMHEEGAGVEQSYEEAAKFYQAASAQSVPRAWHALGYLYSVGLGVTQDKQAARLLRKAAADAGMPEAQYELGRMYRLGMGGPADLAAARVYYRKAAAQGKPESIAELAIMAEYGEGMDKDLDAAKTLYEAAVELGSGVAMNNLGDMYEVGRGVHQDIQKAIELYRRGAAHGDASAMFSISTLFERGVGLPQHAALAYTYLEMSVLNDNKKVSNKRDEIGTTLTDGERERARLIAAGWRQGMPLPGFSESSASPAAPE